MATAVKDKSKLKEQLERLELEELAIEKQILNGEISKEEGQQKRTALALQSQEIDTQLATDAPAEEASEHRDDQHKDDKHKKNGHDAAQGIVSENEEKKEEENKSEPNTADTDTTTQSTQPPVAPSPTVPFKPTVPNPQVAAQFNPPPAVQPSNPGLFSRFRSTPLVAKGTHIYRYTPLGFLSGVISDRTKEWELAKKTTDSIQTLSSKKQTTASFLGKSAKRLPGYTPPMLIWKHLVPESARTAAEAAVKNVSKNVKSSIPGRSSVENLMGPLSQGATKTQNFYGKLYKKTPFGILWKNFVPDSTKTAALSAVKNRKIKTPEKVSQVGQQAKNISSNAQKKATNAYTKAYSKTPLGKLFKKLPEKAQDQIKNPLKTAKSAKGYQRLWNTKAISNAAKRGYDRFGLLHKVRNSKVFKSKAWKYGKYAISPLASGMHDRKQYLESRTKQHEGGSITTHTKLSRVLQGQNPYSEWTSPRSLGGKAWRRFGSKRVSRLNNALGRKIGNKAGGKLASTVAKKAAQQVAQTGVKALLLNPATLAVAGIILLVILAIIFTIVLIVLIVGGGDGGGSENSDDAGTGPIGNTPVTANPIPGFTLSLTGTTTLNTCDTTSAPECIIEYTATYSYSSSSVPLESITIHNNIPPSTVFVSATGDYQQEGNRISWPLDRVNNQKTLTFKIRPTSNNIQVTNKVFANTTFTGGSGNLSNILPSSIESSEAVDAAQQQVVNQVIAAPDLIASYQAVERATGVPWQVLAGIHHREGSLDPNMSLASGRRIGEREPDIERGGGCSSTYTEGEPVALPGGGCGFRTFTDSAIFAANHLKSKNGGNVPASFQDLAKSLAYYNGYPGNSNCYHGAPYPNCPAVFPGDDNPYVMNLFDKSHEIMYVIFCKDGIKCIPPDRDTRPGVASVIMGLSRFYNTTQL